MIARFVRHDDAQTRLTRALERSAAAAGVTMVVTACRWRPWSSATFEGVQLELALEAAPEGAARAWLDGLAEVELPMRGHVAMPPAVDAVAARGDGLAVELAVLVLLDG